MSQKIEIEIGNGFKLVAEQNADQIYEREIFIGVVDKNGAWVQDLAVARNTYDYSECNLRRNFCEILRSYF